MGTALLNTKLHIPSARPELVRRPHLIDRLNAGIHRKRTLVSAPAGFGKTTLVSDWVGSTDRPASWFSLDEGDNDSTRFLTYVLAALQRVDAHLWGSAETMLQTPQPPEAEVLLTSLINDIGIAPSPFLLVPDDYHLIQTLAIHQQVAFLVEHLPDRLHLVIASREDLLLPLSRLRARGQMLEIGRADLQFTQREAAEFLRRTAEVDLSSRQLAALHQRAEGWATGLRLAALSLRGRNDVEDLVHSFAGSHRYVLDYLVDEVFERQAPDVQDFLLKTSILDRFTAPLCDAVRAMGTDHDAPTDSRAILTALEQANLFIVPLDESRQWYRYHRLFAELLRQHLRTLVSREVEPQLHMEASRWFEAEALPDEAIHHAFQSAEWERSSALILAHSSAALKRGEVSTLLR